MRRAPRSVPTIAAVLAGLAAAAVMTGCSSGENSPAGGAAGTGVPRVDTGAIAWEDCGENLECGTLEVPLDHADPNGVQATLALSRHLARSPQERIGSLLVNPGGPGVSGLILAEVATSFFGDDLLDRFDIVAFDPRGVGASTPLIDCVDDYDRFYALDPTPDDEAERIAVAEANAAYAQGCSQRVGDEVLVEINTANAARDLETIRVALGEAQISYFGFSYGSELGAVWATLYPDTVRAAVLDSAEAPNDDSDAKAIADAVAMERSFQDFLSECGADPDCAFHNDGAPAAAYTELMASLDAEPLEVTAGRPAVNEAVAAIAVLSSLYGSDRRDDLAQALSAAQAGDGSALLASYDGYLGRDEQGVQTDEFEALIAYSCNDEPGKATVEEIDALQVKLTQAAPLLGQLEFLPYVCAMWPVEPEAQVTITGAGAGPIVVIGSSGDPITSIESSAKMAAAIEDGVFVTVVADQHIAYGVNDCGDDAIERYLVDLVVPEDGLVCP